MVRATSIALSSPHHFAWAQSSTAIVGTVAATSGHSVSIERNALAVTWVSSPVWCAMEWA